MFFARRSGHSTSFVRIVVPLAVLLISGAVVLSSADAAAKPADIRDATMTSSLPVVAAAAPVTATATSDAAGTTGPTTLTATGTTPVATSVLPAVEVAETADETTTSTSSADAPAPVAPAPVVVVTTAEPAPPPSVETLITGRAMYATSSVNVRNAAGTDGTDVIGGLSPREQVMAGETVDGWAPVHAGSVYGWVSATYLAEGIPPAETTSSAPGPRSTDGPAAAAPVGNWMTDLVGQVDPHGYATWVFSRNNAWGASDGHTIWIDPSVPTSKRYSVMVHEYSHVLEVRVYGSLRVSVAALSAVVGGSANDNTANESVADCMALMQGATWTNYGCQDALRPAAAAILVGRKP